MINDTMIDYEGRKRWRIMEEGELVAWELIVLLERTVVQREESMMKITHSVQFMSYNVKIVTSRKKFPGPLIFHPEQEHVTTLNCTTCSETKFSHTFRSLNLNWSSASETFWIIRNSFNHQSILEYYNPILDH